MLIGAVGEIGLNAHIDDLLGWQPSHLSRIGCILIEGVNVIIHLHLQSLHRVNDHVLRSHATELALILRKTYIMDSDFCHLGTVLTLAVLVEIERVYCLALHQVEDAHTSVTFHRYQQTAGKTQVHVDDRPGQS
jgi:hypothetical protein